MFCNLPYENKIDVINSELQAIMCGLHRGFDTDRDRTVTNLLCLILEASEKMFIDSHGFIYVTCKGSVNLENVVAFGPTLVSLETNIHYRYLGFTPEDLIDNNNWEFIKG